MSERGLKRLRYTSLFRAVNFELFVKPVSIVEVFSFIVVMIA